MSDSPDSPARRGRLIPFLQRVVRESCHWLSSEPSFSFSLQRPRRLGSHVRRKHGHLPARLFLQLLLPLKRGEIFIETNCLSLQGAESSECRPMKIHWVVIVIRCEGSGGGVTDITPVCGIELLPGTDSDGEWGKLPTRLTSLFSLV